MGYDDQAMFEKTTKFYAESATEWQLKLIVWEFFCTLTWSGRARNCVRKRRTHVTRWLGYWARTVRPAVADPLGHLAFVIRWERGEIGGLPRCHILISRFPERSINPSTCFAMKNTWKHGIAQVRLYDPYGPGDVARYLSKGRFSSAEYDYGAGGGNFIGVIVGVDVNSAVGDAGEDS